MSQHVNYNAVITVLGRDRVGIIACVSQVLAELKINVSDISQTILNDMFTMIMLVDCSASASSIEAIAARLNDLGKQENLEIRIQHKDIFNAMHRI